MEGRHAIYKISSEWPMGVGRRFLDNVMALTKKMAIQCREDGHDKGPLLMVARATQPIIVTIEIVEEAILVGGIG